MWAAVSRLLANGIGSLHVTILYGMAVGAIAGVVITVAEQLAPPHVRKWLPSATGLGLAFVILFPDSIAFLIGAALSWVFQKVDLTRSETYIVPVASGLIAGESIMGIAIALLGASGIM